MVIAVIALLIALTGLLLLGLALDPRPMTAVVENDEGHKAVCERCSWASYTFSTEELAVSALVAHLRTHK